MLKTVSILTVDGRESTRQRLLGFHHRELIRAHTCNKGMVIVMITCLSGREGDPSVGWKECAIGDE